MATTILFDRLVGYVGTDYDPWCCGFTYDPIWLDGLSATAPENKERFSTGRSSAMAWTAEQHGARILSIAKRKSWYNDPIYLDNEAWGHKEWSYIAPRPIVVDGWHRYYAHLYLKAEEIRVHYAGRTDVLRYLQGRRKTAPKEDS